MGVDAHMLSTSSHKYDQIRHDRWNTDHLLPCFCTGKPNQKESIREWFLHILYRLEPVLQSVAVPLMDATIAILLAAFIGS